MRSALQPSLRRRVALTSSAMFTVGSFVVADACVIVYHVLLQQEYEGCGTDNFPAFPTTANCYYSGLSSLAWTAVAVLMVALVVWGWWRAAGWVLRPLSATAETVRRLGPQNLGQRIRLDGGADALKELADAIDDALDRLAAGYESQRRFAANASHELRTPLAVQRLLTEVAMEAPDAGEDLRRLGAQLLLANDRNERLIEGLLVLAESDRGLPGKVPVRLDELAESVLQTHAELAGQHDVTLRGKLDQPAEAVPALLEPFRRLGADRVRGRGGVGLGLAIVRSIVGAHQGTLDARARPEGGLIVTVELPRQS